MERKTRTYKLTDSVAQTIIKTLMIQAQEAREAGCSSAAWALMKSAEEIKLQHGLSPKSRELRFNYAVEDGPAKFVEGEKREESIPPMGAD